MDPEGQKYPAVQFPVQRAVLSPETSPYVPPGQGPVQDGLARPAVDPYSPAVQLVHAEAPEREYVPGGQMFAGGVEVTVPAGQAYPALQFPEQEAFGSARLEPYSPAGQSVQASADAREYVPRGHAAAVALVDPGTQK